MLRPTTTCRSVTFEDEIKEHDIDCMHDIVTQVWDENACGECTPECGLLMARCMQESNDRDVHQSHSFLQNYSLKKGIKKWGERAWKSAFGKMSQLHKRVCFHPMSIKALTPREKKRAVETLTFLVEKRDSRTKSKTCANGSVQRGWMNGEESASPTAALESVMITGVIDTHEHQDMATVDVPNAFAQAHMKCT